MSCHSAQRCFSFSKAAVSVSRSNFQCQVSVGSRRAAVVSLLRDVSTGVFTRVVPCGIFEALPGSVALIPNPPCAL